MNTSELLVLLGVGSTQILVKLPKLPGIGDSINVTEEQILAGNPFLANFRLTITEQGDPVVVDCIPIPIPYFGYIAIAR